MGVVSEARLQHVNLRIKLDTNWPVGEVGAPVRSEDVLMGILSARNYGCVFLEVGGAPLIQGMGGETVVRLMASFARRDALDLQVEGGSHLRLQLGAVPLIDGLESGAVKVGCGSAILATFATHLAPLADEVLVVDPEIGGLFTENSSGEALGARYSGVKPRARRYYPGRYHFARGDGWGGTDVRTARDAIESVDHAAQHVGIRILVIENTGKHYGLLTISQTGELCEVAPTPEIERVAGMIYRNSEPSRVSGLLLFSPVEAGLAEVNGAGQFVVAGAPARPLLVRSRILVVDLDQMQAANAIQACATPPALCVPLELVPTTGGHHGRLVDARNGSSA